MPFQSIYPLVASVGLFIMGLGVAVVGAPHEFAFMAKLADLVGGVAHLKITIAVTGIAIMIAGIFLWAHEGNEGYHIHPNKEDLKS